MTPSFVIAFALNLYRFIISKIHPSRNAFSSISYINVYPPGKGFPQIVPQGWKVARGRAKGGKTDPLEQEKEGSFLHANVCKI